ncbi:hypothetical protein PICST_38186 [Scheffersomyces stipitis CBS 6054]|uniref:Uncharacterized protein n=1 Tax=Scheffersomyces stipitis (strain ATCC 58785 / CBS 6054 / NBRC 10063 / NRRL Y-11545) TaxID=322104 RepID=A3GGM4_PICST|nr:predicted protein [Scheffersomyces stipitis CBS 6054]EAZ63954.1 hypothetical protein PICST_38186 [Scheffersomyces stipitis CBS 6054]KAG2734985.1 hypothetical protein G9P44_001199 [Scheffersomyces stipitis]
MANPQEEVYKEFLNYDWESFSEFQTGLQEILDSHLNTLKEQDASIKAIPALDRQQLTDQAKSFFFCSHTGNILNLDDFQQWRFHNGDKFDKKKKIQEITDTEIEQDEEQKTGANEEAEQEQELKHNSETIQQTHETEHSTEDPPYSSNYQHLVELIVSGKPVPGIKDIPDTVLSEKKSDAIATQRVKPWEKNKTAADTSFLE